VLLSCDYSQIELRVLAHMSGDPALTEAFVSHADVHAATASRVFGVPLEEVTSDQRRQAKTINFAVIYGQSAFALATTLGVDNKTAGEWIKEYFNRLPGVQRFIAETTASARTNRYVTTLMGRRRYLPELDSPNHSMRQFAERAAVNMPIQGTAADIMKLAMIEVYHEVAHKWSKPCKLLLQVHDELLFEVDEGAVSDVTPVIRGIMESVYPLSVPLTADAKVGPNWADMKAQGKPGLHG
jgi:DNA polymerase-1